MRTIVWNWIRCWSENNEIILAIWISDKVTATVILRFLWSLRVIISIRVLRSLDMSVKYRNKAHIMPNVHDGTFQGFAVCSRNCSKQVTVLALFFFLSYDAASHRICWYTLTCGRWLRDLSEIKLGAHDRMALRWPQNTSALLEIDGLAHRRRCSWTSFLGRSIVS